MKRRELIKWAPPIVTAVTLPAHAQTSFLFDTCEILSINVSATPNSGIVQVGDKITIQLTYELSATATNDLQLNIGADSSGTNNGLISLLGNREFTVASGPGSQTVEAEVSIVQPGTVFTEISVSFAIASTTTSGSAGCFAFEILTIPVNLTGS